LDDERYPEGSITLYRAVETGPAMLDEIRPGDWVTDQREYAEEHLRRYFNGNGQVFECETDGRDVLVSPTGNAEEAIYAPREFSGPYVEIKAEPLPAPVVASAPMGKHSERFSTWFAGSKVARWDGSPVVVYHGTHVRTDGAGDIYQFDRKFTAKTLGRDQNIDMIGSWFSDNHDADGALMYAGANPNPANLDGVIYPVYLSIKNPKVYATFDALRDEFKRFHGSDAVSESDRARNDRSIAQGDADGFVEHMKQLDFGVC
jgi:hypothetical protein